MWLALTSIIGGCFSDHISRILSSIQAIRNQNFAPTGRTKKFRPALVLSRTMEGPKVPRRARRGSQEARSAGVPRCWGLVRGAVAPSLPSMNLWEFGEPMRSGSYVPEKLSKNKVEIEYFSLFLQAGIVFPANSWKISTQYVSIKLHKVTLTTAHFYVTTAQFVINCTLKYALAHRSLDVPFLSIRTTWYYCARQSTIKKK